MSTINNAHMGGVDLGEQYRKYYQVRMKSCKSYINLYPKFICPSSLFTLYW